MALSTLRLQILIPVLFALTMAGCESVGYYGQAIHGQLSILNQRQPIDQMLAEPGISEELKVKLKQVLRIRQFAQNRLFLPVNGNFLNYVELQRPNVLWNVFAAPEFSLTPKTWCFPIIGCTAYRGYFSEEKARSYAEKLKSAGMDVYIGGVSAFSTLGWFDDPILSTVIDRPEAELASLIFHELAHRILYVDNDTTFNESFATAVAQEGVRRWALDMPDRDLIYEKYLTARHRREMFAGLVMKYRDQLNQLYCREMAADDMRHQKIKIIAAMRGEYKHLKQQWGGFTGYDRWVRASINNAKLNTVSTYHKQVPAFLNLLRRSNGD
ncbi:MAG: aminopeptidase, partial [Deltaproteobacteria bacterium]